MTFAASAISPPPGFWHNCARPCGALGCAGFEAASERIAGSFAATFAKTVGDAFARGLADGLAGVIELELMHDGSYRMPGPVSAEELEELERMHDAGDIRAEHRLRLLREGRRR